MLDSGITAVRATSPPSRTRARLVHRASLTHGTLALVTPSPPEQPGHERPPNHCTPALCRWESRIDVASHSCTAGSPNRNGLPQSRQRMRPSTTWIVRRPMVRVKVTSHRPARSERSEQRINTRTHVHDHWTPRPKRTPAGHIDRTGYLPLWCDLFRLEPFLLFRRHGDGR
jgi:hypothetical protein